MEPRQLGVRVGVGLEGGARVVLFFFSDTATTEIYSLSLHDALPIWWTGASRRARSTRSCWRPWPSASTRRSEEHTSELQSRLHLVCRLLLEKTQIQSHTDTRHRVNAESRSLSLLTAPPLLSPLVLIFIFVTIFYFFNDTATTEIYTLSLHDALPISASTRAGRPRRCATSSATVTPTSSSCPSSRSEEHTSELQSRLHLVCRPPLEKTTILKCLLDRGGTSLRHGARTV